MKKLVFRTLLCLPLFGQLPLPYYPNGPSEIMNANQLQGFSICSGTPANANSLVYSTASACWQAAPVTSINTPFWLRYLGTGGEGAYTCSTCTCGLYGEHTAR